jgi:NADH-quinone oxidoreductase subunit E
MCTGRIDLAFILRAFMNGDDGVFVGGCWPGECHYITEGNYIALSTVQIGRKLMEMIGLDPQRLRLEWISASEGSRYAEVMNDFSSKVKQAGPLGEGEGIDAGLLQEKLETLMNMVPYLKLVERERFRVPVKTVEEYTAFFNGPEFDRMLNSLVRDKFEICMMMNLLRRQSCTPLQIAQALRIGPSDVSRHLATTARQGLCCYDESQNLYAAALSSKAVKNYSTSSADNAKTKVFHSAAMDNRKIDEILDEFKGKPGNLIHALMEIQEENRWIPKEILDRISEKLDVPLNRVMQVASFYKVFSLTPKGRNTVHVCSGTSCHLRGASSLMHSLEELTGVKAGHTDANANFTLEHGNCLGCCTLGPEMIVNGKHHGRLTTEKAEQIMKTAYELS